MTWCDIGRQRQWGVWTRKQNSGKETRFYGRKCLIWCDWYNEQVSLLRTPVVALQDTHTEKKAHAHSINLSTVCILNGFPMPSDLHGHRSDAAHGTRAIPVGGTGWSLIKSYCLWLVVYSYFNSRLHQESIIAERCVIDYTGSKTETSQSFMLQISIIFYETYLFILGVIECEWDTFPVSLLI